VPQSKTTHTRPMTSIPAAAGEWKEYSGDVYRCRVYLVPGNQGGLVATAAGLPNVSGGGLTEAEALASVTAALRAHGRRPSPESQTEEPPPGVAVRWVIVHPQ
jgi:hypothetical protein